jgi:rubrerythrin
VAGELLQKLNELKKLIVKKNNEEFKKNAVEILNPANIDEEVVAVEADAIRDIEIEAERQRQKLVHIETLIREAIAEEQKATIDYINRAQSCRFEECDELYRLFTELASDEIIHASALQTALDVMGLSRISLIMQGAEEAIEVMTGVSEATEFEKQGDALEKQAEKERKEFDFVAEYTKDKAEYDKEKVVDQINNVILGKSSVDDLMTTISQSCKKSSKKEEKDQKSGKNEKKSQKSTKKEDK